MHEGANPRFVSFRKIATRTGPGRVRSSSKKAGVPSVDIIDLEYEPWHTAKDTLDAVSARSLQVVGDVLLAALPQIEARLSR